MKLIEGGGTVPANSVEEIAAWLGKWLSVPATRVELWREEGETSARPRLWHCDVGGVSVGDVAKLARELFRQARRAHESFASRYIVAVRYRRGPHHGLVLELP